MLEGALSLTGDNAARFEAGADRFVGGGRAQHAVDPPRKSVSSLGLSAFGGIAMPTMALKGCKMGPWPGKQPIYTKATDKRILKLLGKPPPEGFARWTGPPLLASRR